jgi:hypothetical protein
MPSPNNHGSRWAMKIENPVHKHGGKDSRKKINAILTPPQDKTMKGENTGKNIF